MKEIQGKLILVQVSMKFKLQARVKTKIPVCKTTINKSHAVIITWTKLINVGSKIKIYKSRQILWWTCNYHKRFVKPGEVYVASF